MKKRVKQIGTIWIWLALAACLWGCTPDRELTDTRTDKPEQSLTFSVRIPVPAVPHTYAMNGGNEDQVKEIDMLLFTSTSSGSSTYQGVRIAGRSLALSGASSNVITFTVKVPEGTYDLVVLANCRAILNDPSVSFAKGDTKASVLSKLKVDLGTTNGWNAAPGSIGYIAIPMWGEMPNQVVNASTPSSLSMSLTRMLAKIDVSVDASLQSQFKLKSVRLYNRYTEGSVAPLAINWNDGLKKVSAPSPLGAKTQAGLEYTVATPFKAYLGEIYTFEALAGTPFSPSATPANNTNTCLVIGGTYGSDTQETFYRIDWVNTTEATPRYLPLLRNHKYQVDIQQIEHSGYLTAAAAFAAGPINIKADIVVYDEGKMTQMVYDDQYLLGVSAEEFTLTREARTMSTPYTDHTLWVTTDVPAGWSVDRIVDEAGNDISSVTNPTTGWLTLNPVASATMGTVETKLLLFVNGTGRTRTGYIHLRAGRLTYVVAVHQTADSALMLALCDGATNSIELTELVFTSPVNAMPSPQSIQLSWLPVDQSVSVAPITGGGGTPFVYAPGSNTPGVGSETSYTDASGMGTKPLTIQPTALTTAELTTDPFGEKASRLDFTVSNGADYISKTIYLRQYAYNLLVDQPSSFYRLDGRTYTLLVKCNTNWRIKSVTATVTPGTGTGPLLNLLPTDNLREGVTGGANTLTGTPVTFTVIDDVSTLCGTLQVVLGSSNSPAHFSDKVVTIDLGGEYYPDPHNGWAGSNIYWDGSKMTFDDVDDQSHKNYQGLLFQWGSLWGISPVGNWSTSTILYNPMGGRGAATDYGYGIYTNIPRTTGYTYTSNPPSGKSNRHRGYLYEVTRGSAGVGDICRHLTAQAAGGLIHGKKWRMPTSMEYDTSSGGYGAWSVSGTWAASNDEGTVEMVVGRTKSNTNTPFFPASGSRKYDDGHANYANSNGQYWSSSPNGGQSAYYFSFDNSNVYPGIYGTYHGFAFAVRCVAE